MIEMMKLGDKCIKTAIIKMLKVVKKNINTLRKEMNLRKKPK